MEELTPAAHVILGMLALGPMSGYDIKRFVDISTRHFWAISYGQIYPELRRLEGAGLVAAQQPVGGRRRTVYSLTASGEKNLLTWLINRSEGTFELRDELLLKLFFADRLPRSQAIEIVRAMRNRHQRLRNGLEQTEPLARTKSSSFPYLVLRFGIDLHAWVEGWCQRAERELEERGDVRKAGAFS